MLCLIPIPTQVLKQNQNFSRFLNRIANWQFWGNRNTNIERKCDFIFFKIMFRVRINLVYFRISLGWDKNKWGKWSLLLISWSARYQSLKFDCKCYYPLLFFLFLIFFIYFFIFLIFFTSSYLFVTFSIHQQIS